MKKKFFTRRVVVYLITMLIPMLVLFIAFGVMNMRAISRNLKEQGKQTVDSVEVNFDLVLSNVLYQNDLLTGTTRMNLALKRMLDVGSLAYGDAVNISSLRSILSSIKDSHEYIDSIYIYPDGAERFFSSEKGINLISNAEDTGWILVYEQMEEGLDSYIGVRTIDQKAAGERQLLSIYKRLVLQKGCIVVNIDLNKFQNILRKQVSGSEETVILVNRDGVVLAQQSSGSEKGDWADYFGELVGDFGTEWKQEVLSRDGKWQKTESGTWLMTVGEYPEMDVLLVSAISERARWDEILEVLRYFLLFLVIDLGVVVFLAYVTTKRSFDQISYMIQVFDQAEQGLPVKKPERKNRDEYDVIMNNIIYLFLNTNYLNKKLMENEYKRTSAEMMALQLQINPHFLFNTLQTVDMEIRDDGVDKEEISMIIRYLSDILKYALADPGESVTVMEEIQYLKKYVAIQKFRFGDRFIIYYEVEEEAACAKVFRLFLQPLVENSLSHGIRNVDRKGYIRIAIRKRENKIQCRVTDTGAGMEKAEVEALYERMRNEKSRGIGLTNLYRRLLLHYGEGSALHIRSQKGMGTSVSFEIPFEELIRESE